MTSFKWADLCCAVHIANISGKLLRAMKKAASWPCSHNSLTAKPTFLQTKQWRLKMINVINRQFLKFVAGSLYK